MNLRIFNKFEILWRPNRCRWYILMLASFIPLIYFIVRSGPTSILPVTWQVAKRQEDNVRHQNERWVTNAEEIQIKETPEYRDEVKRLISSLPPLQSISSGLSNLLSKPEVATTFQDFFKKNKTTILGDVFRNGDGLETGTTTTGEEVWIENGVVYRPYRQVKERFPEFPSPFTPEFEPYIPYNHEMFFEGRPHPPVKQNQKKIILHWIKFRYDPPMDGLEPMRYCPEFPCVMTLNKSYSGQSAAIVFAGDQIRGKPPPRRQDQVFIYHNHEPPCNWYHRSDLRVQKSPWNNVFNWTMTYMHDSDITSLYGITRRRKIPITRDYNAILAKKTKMVAWIVSNCNTHGKRDKYVQELRKYIPVDIYGDCGKLKCPRSNDDACFQMVNTTYKFYLSFESSLCKDYISEKFFRYLAANTITIARASNDFYAHAPPEIFLNTADFPSPKALAERLLYLANNKDEYIKMLTEKDKYMFIYEDYPIREGTGEIKSMHYHYEAVSFCRACQRLWNLPKYAKEIPDIRKWTSDKLCHAPTDLNF